MVDRLARSTVDVADDRSDRGGELVEGCCEGTVALSDRAQSARPIRSTNDPPRRLLNRANEIASEARRPAGDSKIAPRWLNATEPDEVGAAQVLRNHYTVPKVQLCFRHRQRELSGEQLRLLVDTPLPDS